MEKNKQAQYLLVKISGRWVGVDVTDIIEIVKPEDSTLRAGADKQTISYRGNTIPIISLADILIGGQVKYETSHRILISEMGDKAAGLVVDSAEEIIRISRESLQSHADIETGLNADVLEGIITMDDRRIHIVSLERIYQLAQVE